MKRTRLTTYLSQQPLLLTASSVEQAIKLKEVISNCDDYPNDCLKTGIFLGKSTYISLSEQELSYIQYWLHDLSCPTFPTISQSFSRIFKASEFDLGCVYQTNEHAILRDADNENTEWLIKIQNFIVYGPLGGSYHFYVKGKFYAAKSSRGEIECDPWTSCA